MNIYDFKIKDIDGEEVDFKQFKGKSLVIANTASKCGFTPQYAGLEALYKKYSAKGLVVLGFPCNQFAEQEPGTSTEVKNFCEINYGVTFPLFEKIDVRDENIHPLFKYLIENSNFEGIDSTVEPGKHLVGFIKQNFPKLLEGDSIKWNFTKFLIDKEGKVVKRFEPVISPIDMEKYIEEII
jgi:glutathione peroxidase